MQNVAKYRWRALLLVDLVMVFLVHLLIQSAIINAAGRAGVYIGLICTYILAYIFMNIQYWYERKLILEQVHAHYFCGEFSAYLQYKENRHEVEWTDDLKISVIMVIDKYTQRTKTAPYLALWPLKERPPRGRGFILYTVKAFHGVLLPDTPEVRQYLQKRLGLKEIPEYPHTAIYSPSQQDPQWVEE